MRIWKPQFLTNDEVVHKWNVFQKLSKAEGAKSKKNINNAFENKIF